MITSIVSILVVESKKEQKNFVVGICIINIKMSMKDKKNPSKF